MDKISFLQRVLIDTDRQAKRERERIAKHRRCVKMATKWFVSKAVKEDMPEGFVNVQINYNGVLAMCTLVDFRYPRCYMELYPCRSDWDLGDGAGMMKKLDFIP